MNMKYYSKRCAARIRKYMSKRNFLMLNLD